MNTDHREWFYSGIAWLVMDLRQDITWSHEVMDEPYPYEDLVERLYALEGKIKSYADTHFPTHGNEES